MNAELEVLLKAFDAFMQAREMNGSVNGFVLCSRFFAEVQFGSRRESNTAKTWVSVLVSR